MCCLYVLWGKLSTIFPPIPVFVYTKINFLFFDQSNQIIRRLLGADLSLCCVCVLSCVVVVVVAVAVDVAVIVVVVVLIIILAIIIDDSLENVRFHFVKQFGWNP